MGLVAADPADEHLVPCRRRGAASARPRARRPGVALSSSRASSADSGSRVCTLTASEWQTRTGTRTQVTATPIDSILEDLARLEHHLALLVGVVVSVGE